MLAPAPAIVVENAVRDAFWDDTLAPSKRRRLEPLGDIANEVNAPWLLGPPAEPPTICGSTIVCFGMVGLSLLDGILSAHAPQIEDRPVMALSETTVIPSCTQETVFFTNDRELRRCINGALVGRLVGHSGEVLSRLAEDDELILRLAFSTSLMAPGLDTKPPKGTVGFLGIIVYGPGHRSSDVGYFMTQCGYYLEDPIGCEWNVPYINPQCLFSLHELPPMTFDLPRIQQNSVDHLTSTPSDILAGFETTHHLLEAATPTALRTRLKPYVKGSTTCN